MQDFFAGKYNAGLHDGSDAQCIAVNNTQDNTKNRSTNNRELFAGKPGNAGDAQSQQEAGNQTVSFFEQTLPGGGCDSRVNNMSRVIG